MLLTSLDTKRTLMHLFLFTNSTQRELVSIFTQSIRNWNFRCIITLVIPEVRSSMLLIYVDLGVLRIKSLNLVAISQYPYILASEESNPSIQLQLSHSYLQILASSESNPSIQQLSHSIRISWRPQNQIPESSSYLIVSVYLGIRRIKSLNLVVISQLSVDLGVRRIKSLNLVAISQYPYILASAE